MIIFTCEHCGKEFQRRQNKGQRFCSNKCRAQHLHNNWLDENNHPKNFIYDKEIKYCKICGKQLYFGARTNYCNEHYHQSLEYKNKISSTSKLHNNGGYRKGSGIGKHGWYKGIYCDSSWELAFVIYHLDNNLFIQRCKEKRKYIFNNKEHVYIPDFVTNKGIFEIKGYQTEQSNAKHLQNLDIKILYKNDMQMYLNYAISKYGKDYIKLYDRLDKQVK